jgi:hypothetical protein
MKECRTYQRNKGAYVPTHGLLQPLSVQGFFVDIKHGLCGGITQIQRERSYIGGGGSVY